MKLTYICEVYPKQTVEGVVAQGMRACVSEAQGRGFKSLLSQTDALMTPALLEGRSLIFYFLDLLLCQDLNVMITLSTKPLR